MMRHKIERIRRAVFLLDLSSTGRCSFCDEFSITKFRTGSHRRCERCPISLANNKMKACLIIKHLLVKNYKKIIASELNKFKTKTISQLDVNKIIRKVIRNRKW